MLWEQVLETVRLTILAAAHLSGGSLGSGIVVVSAAVRVALFPLSLRLALKARRHHRRLQALQPKLQRLRKRHKDDPQRLAQESQRLLTANGVTLVNGSGILGALVQAPVFLALFGAIRRVATAGGRFLWIPDIARPDAVLVALVAGATYLAASTSGAELESGQRALLVVPVIATALFLWTASAGVALHWGVSAAASLVQARVVRRLA